MFCTKRRFATDTPCFMPECLNNQNLYCQLKPDNITPNSENCGELHIIKELD